MTSAKTSPLDMFRLDGKVVLVTGGAAGLGQAAAVACAAVGGKVIIADLNEAAAQQTAAKIRGDGGEAFASRVDVSDAKGVADAFNAITKQHGGIDVLINSAGISLRRPAADYTIEEWQRVITINLNGTFFCAQQAGRHMIERGKGGSIINLASVGGFTGGGLQPNAAYKSSKAGVVNLTRALASEWGPHNIRVNAIAPNFVRTAMSQNFFDNPETYKRARSVTPLPRLGELDDIIGAFLYFASPASGWVTGQTIAVDGGYLSGAILP